MTFGRRLLLGIASVLVLSMLVLVLAAERWLRADLEGNVRSDLTREAQLVLAALPADSLAWPGLTRSFGHAAGIRITLIDRSGRVRADTDVEDAQLSGVENHAGRPEVAAALLGTTGTAKRRSATINSDLLYLAIPGGPGVVRVALPLDQVDAVVAKAQRSVLVAALLALLFGGLLAFWAEGTITRPLTETAAAARAIAAGETPVFPRSGVPDMDAMVAALRGMHEELEARFDALARRRAESEALVHAMVEGVLSSNARGEVVTANPAARRLLGYGPDQPLPELQVLFHQKAAREAVTATLSGETIADREIDLDDRRCLLSARPLPSGGAVLVLHDLTDVRRLETVRRDFVANVSHELKTPLTSISGYAETLLSDRPPEETARQFLETILANAQRMQKLVDDQLDLSRIESGNWRPAPRQVATKEALTEAWASLGRPERGGWSFRVTIKPGAEGVRVDPEALRQVLGNLYDNARRHTAADGLIEAIAELDGGGIRISVRDSGSGISGQHLPRIFERFYRADPSRSRAEGGTGLGLAIVKHLVESHGGRVQAESELGRGTSISIWFPTAGPI